MASGIVMVNDNFSPYKISTLVQINIFPGNFLFLKQNNQSAEKNNKHAIQNKSQARVGSKGNTLMMAILVFGTQEFNKKHFQKIIVSLLEGHLVISHKILEC